MRASNDDDVGAVLLCGVGKHFSSGHDLGSPGKNDGLDTIERRTMWYDPTGKPDPERLFVREQEVYLGLCRRWREMPKPSVAAVQGGCIAGGLMLAWVCDLIVASEDAYFLEPVVGLGTPGVEYFAHVHEVMTNRIAREFLMLGEKFTAERAYQVGMVNRVVPRDRLQSEAMAIAARLAEQPRFSMATTKHGLNVIEDLQGKRSTMEAIFGLHHVAHANNFATHGTSIIRKT